MCVCKSASSEVAMLWIRVGPRFLCRLSGVPRTRFFLSAWLPTLRFHSQMAPQNGKLAGSGKLGFVPIHVAGGRESQEEVTRGQGVKREDTEFWKGCLFQNP